jgi:hypothetical protein
MKAGVKNGCGKTGVFSALTGRPLIAFEYSEDAIRKGLSCPAKVTD